MGRRALAETRKRVNVYVEEALLNRFALLNFDPSQRSGYTYGALSEFVNEALRKHINIQSIKLPEED